MRWPAPLVESAARLPLIRLKPLVTSKTYDRAIERAVDQVFASGHEDISAESLFLFFAFESGADMRAELEKSALTPLAIRWRLCHGDRSENIELPAAEVVALRLHNDAFTTMQFVVEVLTDVVGLDDRSAQKLTLEVHHRGSAVAAVGDRERVLRLAEDIRARANAGLFPLRMSVEPAADIEQSVVNAEEAPAGPPEGERDFAWESVRDDRPWQMNKYARWAVAVVSAALLLGLLARFLR